MSDSSVNIDKLVADFEKRADEAKELSIEIDKAPSSTVPDNDTLIKGVAENLAAIRETAGLTSKGPAHFEQQIKLRQHRPGLGKDSIN